MPADQTVKISSGNANTARLAAYAEVRRNGYEPIRLMECRVERRDRATGLTDFHIVVRVSDER